MRADLGSIGMVLLALAAGGAFAGEVVELTTVQVVSERVADFPSDGHSTSVIEAADIERSAATTVSELIAREANVNLQSYFGNDKYSTLDIRGMGETASSNVVILVDGVRLNEIDLSGADLSGLSLAQIERIRIVRGGGAVRVGDGAVGGVIDITTRRLTEGAVSGSVRLEAGAYGTRKLNANVGARSGPWSLMLRGGRSDTDGFRSNGYLFARDGSAELRFSPIDRFSAFVRMTRHFDEYGLPGPLPASVLSERESARRATVNPQDGGSTDDTSYAAGTEIDFGDFGTTRLQATSRRRENPFITECTAPPCVEAPIHSARDSLQFDHELEIPSSLVTKPHRFGLGLNNWNGDYARFSGAPDVLGTTRISGDVHSHGGYADAALRLGDQWSLNLGARIDRFRSDRVTETLRQPTVAIPVPPFVMPCSSCTPTWEQSETSSKGSWRNHARELGILWDATQALSLHVSVSLHFRSPNIDELALADAALRPQSGQTSEVGFRMRPGAGQELSLSLFRIRIDDEIYFGPEQLGGGASRNRNLPVPTTRHGLEFQLRWPLATRLRGALNFGYVRPRLDGLDDDIPSVPRRTASARLEWRATDELDATLAARFASSARDGNALGETTERPRLASYAVVDAALRWKTRARWAPFSLTFMVNNLFDRAYTTKQYSGGVYPMPGRHVMVAANTSF